MHPRRWLLPVAALVLVLTLPALAPAQEDASETEVQREVDVEQDAEEVAVHLRPTDDEDAETVRLDVEPANGTLALVRGDEDEADSGLELQLDGLIEYRDSDGNGSYDPGEPIASSRALAGGQTNASEANDTVRWGSPIVTDTSRGGSQGSRVVLPAQLGEGGSFQIRIHAFGAPVEVAGTNLAPTSTKLDLVVENYPFEANDTALALLVTGQTPGEDLATDHRSIEDDETGLVATLETDGEATSYLFAWADEATVDGQAAPVETTQLGLRQPVEDAEDPQETRRTGANDTGNGTGADPPGGNVTQRAVAIAYERGDRVVHDPRTDVAVTDTGTRGAPSVGLGAALVVLFAAQALRRRR